MPLGDSTCVDRRRGFESTAQKVRLRISPVFQSSPTPRIGLAGHEKLLKSTRATKCVRLLQYLQNRLVTQFQRAVTMRVVFGDEQREVTARAGHRKSGSDIANQFAAAAFVAGMTGKLTAGRVARRD